MPTVDISEDAWTIIRLKSYEFNVPESVILDAMIREFSPSRPQDVREQIEKNTESFNRFKDKYPDANVEKAWRRGHGKGWEDYQIRKYDSFINLIRAYKNLSTFHPLD